jgi:serine/threonine-protein kinase
MGAIIGTPAYMAPELARGARNARPASDMFALGLIAYELLSGREAWAREPFFTALSGQPLGPVAALPGAVPKDVAAVVLRCLAESPAERPTAPEFLAALEPHATR